MAAEPEPAARAEALPWLWGARTQRVDSPAPGLFALTLYQRGEKQTLLLAVSRARRGLGCVGARPIGQPASGFVRRLRVALENARLERAHWLSSEADDARAAALELSFARKDGLVALVADFDAQAPNLFLLDAQAGITAAADESARKARFPERASRYAPYPRGGVPRFASPEQAAQAGEQLLADDLTRGVHTARARARDAASAALRRARRKLEAISGDLARAEGAPGLRREANTLLCNLREIAPGAAQARLLDQSIDPPEWLDITLDPALSAQQNVERKFARARRLERGVGIASARLAEARAHVDALSAFLEQIDAQTPEALAAAARPLGIAFDASMAGAGTGTPARRERATRVPYRSFEASGGALVLVGKGAADNDTLTLTVARPHDLWLHARGVTGSHVVVPRERNREPAPELLLDAAHLAVHFSAARGEALSEVQHTERRYVRKPKGSPPGAVRVDRERVLLLRLEPERLRRLLAAERANSPP